MEDLQLQDSGKRSVSTAAVVTLSCLLLFAVPGCGSDGEQQTKQKSYDELSISVADFVEIIEQGRDIFLLDVRTESEFAAGHLGNTDMRLPYDSLSYHMARIPADKKTEIYCFCRTGRRSRIAAGALRAAGYLSVFSVSGGLVAWQKAGYEVVRGE